MDKKNDIENLLDIEVTIPDVVQQKAMDAFAQIQEEAGKTFEEKADEGKKFPAKKTKKWLKPLVAVAACFALIVTSIGASLYRQKNPGTVVVNPETAGAGKNHRFSIQVMAAEKDGELAATEVVEGQAIPVAMGGVSDGWSMGTSSDNCVTYSFNLPFTCVGEDVETITYDINKGNFYVEHPIGDGYVVSGVEATEGAYTDWFESEIGNAVEKYDSYTVNYNYQSGEHVRIYLQDYMMDRPDIVELMSTGAEGLEYIRSNVEAISRMMEDKIMTVTATFKDGTTEEYHIVFGATSVYLELGVEPERIQDSYMNTIVCMVGKEDMDATTAVRSTVNEEDWDITKRQVKHGDDVTVEKQRRYVGPDATEEAREWFGYWNSDREVIHVTEENAILLGHHIKDAIVLDASAEATGESQEEFRYVILSISQTPEIVYGNETNMYLGAHTPQREEKQPDETEVVEPSKAEVETMEVPEGNLTAEELAFFSDWCSSRENYGFFLSNYTSPEYIDYGQVLYCGAGIESSTPWSDADYAAYLEASGSSEITTDVTFVRKVDLEPFVLRKTGMKLEEMKKVPLVYSEKTQTYYTEHGDTNYTDYKCISGIKDGDKYSLWLKSDMYDDYTGYVELCKVGDDYHMVSCMCKGGVSQ